MPARALFLGVAFLWTSALPAQVTAVDSVGITVSDMDRAIDFYMEIGRASCRERV